MDENQKKKIIILTLVAIVIFVIAILLIIKLISLKNNDETILVNNNEEISNTIQEENIIEDTEELENELNNTVNEVIPEENEESVKEEIIIEDEPVADPEQEIDKETMEKIESDEEKALRIAEEDWKQGGNVKFTHESVVDGKHIVYVRDSKTRRHIATYKINVETGTFEKE